MGRVLVTGGSGFIGSHVVDRALSRGLEVVNYDLRESPYHDAADVRGAIGDLTDLDTLTKALDGVDAVLHLAAVADVNDVTKDPVRADLVNVRGTATVLEAARQAGVGRVVYASTIWVYNGLEGTVDEDSPLAPPNNFYTATKLAGEHYCTAYRDHFELASTIVRFGIPYGTRAREAAVVPSFVRRVLEGEPITITGAGTQTRRFVWVEDLAEGMARGLDDIAGNRTYNLVGTESTSVSEIAETVRELLGTGEIIHTEARTADFTGAEVSGTRAETELGWTAETPFREGVRRYIEWRREADPATLV